MTTASRVPYVTAYTREAINMSLAFTRCERALDGWHLTYTKPRPEHWLLGVLWAQQQTCRQGRPLYKDMHIGRQRECTLGRLCQVCRGTAVDGDGRLWWVFNQAAPAGSMRTAKPPTCRGCIREAVESCRYLRDNPHAYTSSAECDPYGVIGDVYSKTAVRREEIALTEFYQLERTLALGLIVNVRDLRPEPIP